MPAEISDLNDDVRRLGYGDSTPKIGNRTDPFEHPDVQAEIGRIAGLSGKLLESYVGAKLDSTPQTREQFLAGITAKEVVEGDAEYEEAASVGKFPDTSNEELQIRIANLIREKGQEEAGKYWWLNPEWQNALEEGRLREQLTISIGEKSISTHVFDTQLSNEQVEKLCDALELLMQIKDGVVADAMPNIIFHGEPEFNSPKKGSSGTANSRGRFVEITPQGAGTEGFGTEEFSSLEHTVIHEAAHLIGLNRKSLNTSLGRAWLVEMGWRLEDGKWKLASLDGPSTYGNTTPQDDYAESLTYLLMDPGRVNEKRRIFLTEHYFEGSSRPLERTRAIVERRVGSNMIIQTVEPPVIYYKIVPMEYVEDEGLSIPE